LLKERNINVHLLIYASIGRFCCAVMVFDLLLNK